MVFRLNGIRHTALVYPTRIAHGPDLIAHAEQSGTDAPPEQLWDCSQVFWQEATVCIT
jgi:hypothetical protein